LLYFYAKAYVSDAFEFLKVHLWHLLPFVVYNLAMLPFYSQTAAYKLHYDQEVLTTDAPWQAMVALVAKTLTIPVYLVWTLILLRNHRRNIARYFSDLEKIDLRWLQYLVWSMVVVWGFALISAVIKFRTHFEDAFHSEPYIFSAATLWVFGLGYYGLKQTPVFNNAVIRDQPKVTSETPRNNKLAPEVAEQHRQRLMAHMEKEQPYLQSKLTLHQLATELQLPAQTLSELLNDILNQNFFQFVNGYRVEEVKKRLQDPKYRNLTILGIALESGFNSKAAFNRIFKQHTGLIPSAYMKGKAAVI
jgi:AraC-like DNA-binding protein